MNPLEEKKLLKLVNNVPRSTLPAFIDQTDEIDRMRNTLLQLPDPNDSIFVDIRTIIRVK